MAASLLRFTLPLLSLLMLLSAASARNAEDARALAALRRALDPAGRVLGSWNPAGDPCGGSFVGVTCDPAGRVTAVSLQGRGLAGSLPPAVAGLRRLQGLYLHYNGIKGPIPREIGKLSELTDLYLDLNHLTGPVPVEIAAMVNLQGGVFCFHAFCLCFLGDEKFKKGQLLDCLFFLDSVLYFELGLVFFSWIQYCILDVNIGEENVLFHVSFRKGICRLLPSYRNPFGGFHA
jgi:hypothetical protein